MRKVLIFTAFLLTSAGVAGAAVRDSATTSRATLAANNVSRGTAASTATGATSARTTSSTTSSRGTTPRTSGTSSTTVASRAAATSAPARAAVTRNAATSNMSTISRAVMGQPRATTANARANSTTSANVVSRAAATPVSMSETRTGAEYERCKSAYFTCMDQFCSLKNDDYRRCSCSNRVSELGNKRAVLQEAGQQLTVFTENLDVVGMTAAQAAAMHTASEGENALTSDTSASKALLQAIMNSIRGGDSNVGGKYSDLNSINISFDTVNAFGITDSGQVIASYNGRNLYDAVYPQCRAAVREDCNDASLQRAITAYLMAVEQDCNTVQTAIEETQAQMKAAVREGSAMLDLARVENRQKHNSDDIATCLANVEAAILSEEVCGSGYHRCLDNGEFIDKTTGAPIAGVVRFYELAELLKFSDGVEAAHQKLSRIASNRLFVQNFENRTKKFAAPALDKCTEQADVVWSEYLDKAMLDIYYAQRSKVAEIKQGCFDFVSSCYMNGDNAMTAAMSSLTGETSVILQPYQVAVTGQLCRDYVESCNNMFDGDIIAQYIENRQDTDTLTACRAVVQQCFDKFGGTNYENFYYPYSGLFSKGTAPDWFTLYARTADGEKVLKSECAQQLAKIDACNQGNMLEKAFGGFDSIAALKQLDANQNVIYEYGTGDEKEKTVYGMLYSDDTNQVAFRRLRSTGVATEVYNQIIDILSTQCVNIAGRFVELQFIKEGMYNEDNLCLADFQKAGLYAGLVSAYGIGDGENMCPRDYGLSVDIDSWGVCQCWENGGRRSKWGKSATCMSILPVAIPDGAKLEDYPSDRTCNEIGDNADTPGTSSKSTSIDAWCTKAPTSLNQVCPIGASESATGLCSGAGLDNVISNLPEGIL